VSAGGSPLRAPLPGTEPSAEPVPAAVRELLLGRSAPDGFLPFDRFMDVVLYGAEVGYYARARSPFGPGGDYYTAPRVHPLFARTLAHRIHEVRDALGGRGPFRLVDLGSGDGSLAAGIVRALGERGAADGIEAVVVDRTAARRAASLQALTPPAQGTGVRARAAASLSELGPVRGVVLAHELLDALPARRLRWDGRAWRELGFRLEAEVLVPDERPLVSKVPPPPLLSVGGDDAGVVLEVSSAAAAVVREVADHLPEGLFIVVDYGDEERELRYAHPRGTVAAVRDHRVVAPPSEAPGDTDLSTFVNFTRLRAAASAAGLVEIAYRSQAEALGDWGFPAELERAMTEVGTDEAQVRVRLAAKNLLFGFGNFRVLELAARASAPKLRTLRGASSGAPP